MPKLHERLTADTWWHGFPGYGPQATQRCLGLHLTDRVDALRVLRAIRALYPERVVTSGRPLSPIVAFNDHPDTTLEDVIRVCKVADV